MKLVRLQDTSGTLSKFGYHDTNEAWAQLRASEQNRFRFRVPSLSLKQAALSQELMDYVSSNASGDGSNEAAIWLQDWSIFYEYELRLFWKNMGCELNSGDGPPYFAAYWTSLDASGINTIKAALFMMMAFEFSGCFLMKSPKIGICIDDGVITVSGGDDSLHRVIERIAG